MGFLAILVLVLVAIAAALQNARRHGVAASPVIGWGFVIAAMAGGMIAGGALALTYLGPKFGPAVFLADVALTLIAAIAVGNRVWRRLKSRRQ